MTVRCETCDGTRWVRRPVYHAGKVVAFCPDPCPDCRGGVAHCCEGLTAPCEPGDTLAVEDQAVS